MARLDLHNEAHRQARLATALAQADVFDRDRDLNALAAELTQEWLLREAEDVTEHMQEWRAEQVQLLGAVLACWATIGCSGEVLRIATRIRNIVTEHGEEFLWQLGQALSGTILDLRGTSSIAVSAELWDCARHCCELGLQSTSLQEQNESRSVLCDLMEVAYTEGEAEVVGRLSVQHDLGYHGARLRARLSARDRLRDT